MDVPEASPETSGAQRLTDECRRLVDRLSGVTANWFAARVVSGSGTREERLRELIRTLADIGRYAGSGAPAGSAPHDVGVHALGDQIIVLGQDIRMAPGGDQFADAAIAAVSACYAALWPGLTPGS